jgi:hypothetical protein
LTEEVAVVKEERQLQDTKPGRNVSPSNKEKDPIHIYHSRILPLALGEWILHPKGGTSALDLAHSPYDNTATF